MAESSGKAKKTTSTTKKKTTGTAKKKTTTAKKTTSTTFRLSAEEKKLVTNYRKCNDMTKMMIRAAVEKLADKAADTSSASASGSSPLEALGGLNLDSILSMLGK
jgi:hypothetical protein